MAQNHPSQSSCPDSTKWQVTRRTFLKASASSLMGVALSGLSSCAGPGRIFGPPRGTARFGMVTDMHYADAPPLGTRFYRESPGKLTECIELMNREKVDFLIELGDFKDQDRSPNEQNTIAYLQHIEQLFQTFDGPRYHVLGNHDVDSISKKQYLANIKSTGIGRDSSYYSFDRNGLHFVVLDANYNPDGSDYDRGKFDWTDPNIGAVQLDWLKHDLDSTRYPTICFSHQLYDGTGAVYVTNAEQVRKVLQNSGKVLAVFQGHHHTGDYNRIEGIHYYTLKALIEGTGPENNSYAIVKVDSAHNIEITGYRKAASKDLSPAVASSVLTAHK